MPSRTKCMYYVGVSMWIGGGGVFQGGVSISRLFGKDVLCGCRG